MSLVLLGCSGPDYEARAYITDAMSRAHEARLAVAQHYYSEGEFPDDDAATWLATGLHASARYTVTLTPGTGVVSVIFGQDVVRSLRGKQILLHPITGGPRLRWRCETTHISEDDLPLMCREPDLSET